MKSSFVVLSLPHQFLIILLHAFSACTIARPIRPINTDSCLPVVLDSLNNNLRYDGRYYVVHSFSIMGGGVSRGPNNQLEQSTNEVAFGTPVVFKPMKPTTEEEITESIPLNIVFDNGDNSGTVWKVEGFPGTSPNFLSSNGVEGNPSDVSTWFQLKRVNYFSYTLVFCPTGDAGDCNDVAVQKFDGVKRLFLVPLGNPWPFFPVLFLKVKDGPVPPVVMDSFFFDLRFDRRYFVLNSLSTNGGGTSRSGPSNQLVQSASPVDYGMSVVFKPMPGTQKVELVTESTPLNIVFYTGESYSNERTVWKVEGFPGTSGPYFLSSNGVAGDTNDVWSWFQIKKASYFSFKLVFCPYKNDVTSCNEVGVNEERRLVLTTGKTNFPLVFLPDESSIGKSSL